VDRDDNPFRADTARRQALARGAIKRAAMQIAEYAGLPLEQVHCLLVSEAHRALVALNGEESTIDSFEQFVAVIRHLCRFVPAPTRH